MQLRYFIPLTILISGLALATLLSLVQWRNLTERNTQDLIAQARSLGLFAAAQIETAYRNQNPAIARDVINHLGSFQNIIDAVLFDSTAQVLYATDFRLTGKSITETLFSESLAHIKQARATAESEIFKSMTTQSVIAFFPISLDPALAKLKDPDIGVFAVALDLSVSQRQTNKLVLQSALLTGGFSLLISCLLWLIFGQRLLSRLKQLTDFIQSLSVGLYPQVSLDGKDELALFSRELNRIIRTLEEQHRQLKQSEEQFRTLIELAPEEIFIQAEGKIAYMNQAGLRLLGATAAEQIVGRKVLDFVHPDYRDKVKQRMKALNAGEVHSVPTIEQKFLRLDGTSVDVEVVAARTSYDGHPAVQVFVRDVSEKLMLQQASERANRLAAIGTLAAGVAHEINNPNSVIMHNIPAVRAVWDDLGPLLDDHYAKNRDFRPGGVPYTELREELPQLLQDCVDSSQRIKRIVNDLKNFSKDGDKTTGTEEPLATIDLNDLVETSSRLVMNRIKTSTDHFLLELSPHQPTSRGNFLRLEQVVINLLINACQALTSPAQKIRLVTRHDPERQLNWIEVHDEGRGISETQQEKIFEPFFTTRRETGGTGLGLSISYNIVEEHGGNITLSSAVGEGTCVKLCLASTAESQAARSTTETGNPSNSEISAS